jgi:hypothetical protein
MKIFAPPEKTDDIVCSFVVQESAAIAGEQMRQTLQVRHY